MVYFFPGHNLPINRSLSSSSPKAEKSPHPRQALQTVTARVGAALRDFQHRVEGKEYNHLGGYIEKKLTRNICMYPSEFTEKEIN